MSVLHRSALVLGLLLTACSEPPRPGVPPRHVLLITVEGLRADHVSSLGYDRRTTALLRPDRPIVLDFDLIATSGVSFAQAQAPSSSAERSIASLLAGQVSAQGQPTEGLALPESFQQGGFSTSCFVTRLSPGDASSSAQGFGRGMDHAGFFGSDEETLAAAVAWLESEVPKGAQHFTWLHLAGIQPPFEGEPFADRFSAPQDTAAGRSPAEFVRALESAEQALDGAARRHLTDLYDGRLLRVVELVNSFFFLYENNFGGESFWDESVIAVLGVNGCELADHGTRIGGESLHDAGLRVPVLLSHRQSLTGARILDDVIELPDVSATLRDWFGFAADSAQEGRSLLALTDSYVERDFPPRPALAFTSGGDFSLRNARYRLVVRNGVQQLFDLQVDPLASHDVAALHPEVVQDLIESSRVRVERLGLSF